MHTKRVHLQVNVWATLHGECNLEATDWGWRQVEGPLVPITLDNPIAPDHVLNVIRCKCKGNCSSALCSCMKHGLPCVTACMNCNGTECTNVLINDGKNVDDESDSESDSCTTEGFNDDLGDFSLPMSWIVMLNMKRKFDFHYT